MIRHIVTWNLKEELSAGEKAAAVQKIKAELEALNGRIEGLVELKVHLNALPSSDRAITLSSLLVSEEALQGYQAHPAHQQAAAIARSLTRDRVCLDYHE